jgi:hypothetical protein
LVLESKDNIKARGGRSTDVGDALALTFAEPVAPRRTSVGRTRSAIPDDYDVFAEMNDPGSYNPFAEPTTHQPNYRADWDAFAGIRYDP